MISNYLITLLHETDMRLVECLQTHHENDALKKQREAIRALDSCILLISKHPVDLNNRAKALELIQSIKQSLLTQKPSTKQCCKVNLYEIEKSKILKKISFLHIHLSPSSLIHAA
ncbi:MAG: hypothetical protein VYC40_01380 [Pseudomonadota bacterium]|nr:hypothetical protein [Pseudomonadota bacterium]